ncbi:type II toxin-antitoxin system PemK/MazF family toxin [Campylobacter cuniculorum]|uniref:type II toxin-antitoxin system PemK/MazF family toxin n=1 Tax=Campylobacter cuniculorum TaxID=374106 RepID=UPI0023EFA544|nr:type II toxin-antitoxin system PemK/MazF family toxin [Campylobacter cuniculorum]
MDYNDKFDKWNDRKKEIQIKKDKRIKIGKVYWISIGQNIGSEIYGKGDEFIRPVLVLNKIYIKDYINLFIGIPLSSQVKNKHGFAYHHFEDNRGKKQVALLSQIRTFDTKRIISYCSKIKEEDLNIIKDKIINKIISPHETG